MSASSVVYDIYLSPIKLESTGLILKNRYAVMCDYRGGKRAPLNPAATAVPSHQHSDRGFSEVNWPPKATFEYPFQIPFTNHKVSKEMHLIVKDGGAASNTGANATNAETVGEVIINIGNYCNVLEHECAHKLVEAVFKISGKPALLSLQLAMVPQGIPADTVEPSTDLVARIRGGSGITEDFQTGGKSLKRDKDHHRANSNSGVPSTRVGGGTQAARPGMKLLTIEQVTQLIAMGALDDSVFAASQGRPVEVDRDVGEELIATLARFQAGEEKLAAAGRGMSSQQPHYVLSNYESQTGPIGEAVYTIRAQQTQAEKEATQDLAGLLKAQLDQSIAHAQALAVGQQNSSIYTVDTNRTFELKSTFNTFSKGVDIRALEAELLDLDRQLGRLELQQTRRDVSDDVIMVLDRKGVVEQQIKTLQQHSYQQQAPTSDPGVGFDRVAMLQELVATERAIELLEWRKQARASLRENFRNPNNVDTGRIFASLATTLQPPLPLTFPPIPKRQPTAPQPQLQQQPHQHNQIQHPLSAAAQTASNMAMQGGSRASAALTDEFGFPIPTGAQLKTSMATAQIQAQAMANNQMQQPYMQAAAVKGREAAIAGTAAFANGKASATAAFDDFFGGGPAPISQQQVQQQVQAQAQQLKQKAEDTRRAIVDEGDFFGGGGTGPAAVNKQTGSTSASPVGTQLAAFAASTGHFAEINNDHHEEVEEAPYVPPPAPAPSKWLAGKVAMAWTPRPAPALSQLNKQPTSASASTSAPPKAEQPQWSAPHSLQNAIAGATAAASTAAAKGQVVASQGLDLFAANSTGGWTNSHPNTQPTIVQGQVVPSGAPATVTQASPTQLMTSPLPNQKPTSSPAAPPTTISRATAFMCTYDGNLYSAPIARIEFDHWQKLIVQRDVGNVRVLPVAGDAVAGGGAGGQKRNGFLLRFAGGSGGDGPPATRGIAPTLKTLSWNVESDDFFTPAPLEINSVIMTITGTKVENFGMKLGPKNPSAPAYYELEEAAINELRPFCKPSAEEERALLIWPSQAGAGNGGFTLVMSATFTSNGGAQIRRTIPIKF